MVARVAMRVALYDEGSFAFDERSFGFSPAFFPVWRLELRVGLMHA
jgi:hypothetical protein